MCPIFFLASYRTNNYKFTKFAINFFGRQQQATAVIAVATIAIGRGGKREDNSEKRKQK